MYKKRYRWTIVISESVCYSEYSCHHCSIRKLVLRSKTTLTGLYQNYLANDFSLKMARGEDTCLHSITAARYRKNKKYHFIVLRVYSFLENQMHFSSFSSMGSDVLSYSQNEDLNQKLSFFTRVQNSWRVVLATFLIIINHLSALWFSS